MSVKNFLGYVLGVILVVIGTWQTLQIIIDYPLDQVIAAYWAISVILLLIVVCVSMHRLGKHPPSKEHRKSCSWSPWRPGFIERTTYHFSIILLAIASASWLIGHLSPQLCLTIQHWSFPW
jgi:hypothetical protein